MKTELIQHLTDNFEAHVQHAGSGVEFWFARDLQHLLGYSKWDNFLNVISKAKTACDVSDNNIADHFADVGKMVDLGSESYALTMLGQPKQHTRKFDRTYVRFEFIKSSYQEKRVAL